MHSDVKALNKFNDDGFKKFVDLVLHFLIDGNDRERFLADLEAIAQESGASLNPLKNITKTLLTFFKSAAKQNLSPKFVQEDMENLGTLHLNCGRVVYSKLKRWSFNFNLFLAHTKVVDNPPWVLTVFMNDQGGADCSCVTFPHVACGTWSDMGGRYGMYGSRYGMYGGRYG